MAPKPQAGTVVKPEDFFEGARDQLEALDLDRSIARLSLRDRQLIVEQAILLFEANYAHLPLKKAMHAVSPVQSLRLFRHRLDDEDPNELQPEVLFHREVLSIFNKVRDLHTRYILPEPLRSWTAFLPFRVGEYFERIEPGSAAVHPKDNLWGECERDDDDGLWAPRYVVTRIVDRSESREHGELSWRGRRPKDFAPGAEIVYWNGVHVVRAIELLADQFAGSNSEARRARGLAQLTLRPLGYTVPPDEKWVDVVYRPEGHPRDASEDDLPSVRIYWAYRPEKVEVPAADDAAVRQTVREAVSEKPSSPGLAGGDSPASEQQIRDALKAALQSRGGLAGSRSGALDAAAVGGGMDYETETVRRRAHRLYKGWKRRRMDSGFQLEKIGEYLHPEDDMPILLCFSLRIRLEDAAREEHYGLIKIRTFEVPDVDAFVETFAGMLQDHRLGRRGLILDLRGNGGGRIPAGERLLQLLTHREIEPERMQFFNSITNLELCRRYAPFAGWTQSIKQSVTTGDIYSRGLPLTPVSDCNDHGQRYHGPTVLLTDANCYSTADMFIAGFKDHGIGKILGVHRNTGAGGANNVKHSDLLRLFGNRLPYRPLPHGAEMTVALRRSLRVLERVGSPLEDLGVVPHDRHRLTKDDLLGNGPDIYKKAVSILRGEPTHYLYGWVDSERQDVAYLCHSKHLAIDQFLDGSGREARGLREATERKDAEIDGLEVVVRAFDFTGFPRTLALEVRATLQESEPPRPDVASLKQRYCDLSRNPPSDEIASLARTLEFAKSSS